MATAKKTAAAAPAAKKASAKTAAAPVKSAAKKAAAPATARAAAAASTLKPIKDSFNKTGLNTHLAEVSGVEPKQVKAVMAALEATVFASLNKKGAGEFTLPGLLKISVVNVPAKKKRVGIDPFTKQQREFAAKPASVRIKVRAMKKIKDAAL